MKAVNLLPVSRRPGASRAARITFLTDRPALTGALAATLVVLAALGLLVRSSGASVSAKQGRLAAINTQIAALPRPKAAPASTGAARLAAVTSAAGYRISWDSFLGSLGRVLPEDVWLLSLTADSSAALPPAAPAPVVATAPSAFTITGYTYSQPSVARLLKRLTLLPWLTDVSLVSSSRKVIGTKSVYQVTIGANVVKNTEVGS